MDFSGRRAVHFQDAERCACWRLPNNAQSLYWVYRPQPIFFSPKAQMDYPIQLADQLRQHLRALRKQRGLTQAQLGEQLGIGQARVAEIEARPGVVSVDQLMRILSNLGETLVLREEPARQASIRPAGAVLTIPPKKGSW
jgi:HTH-type transcriptional regulator/antitoxin HipB